MKNKNNSKTQVSVFTYNEYKFTYNIIMLQILKSIHNRRKIRIRGNGSNYLELYYYYIIY